MRLCSRERPWLVMLLPPQKHPIRLETSITHPCRHDGVLFDVAAHRFHHRRHPPPEPLTEVNRRLDLIREKEFF